MSDLPIELDAALAGRLRRAFDVEGKIPRAIESLAGPLAGRDVLLTGPSGDGPLGAWLDEQGARVTTDPTAAGVRSVDLVIGGWSTFRAADGAEVAAADRALRPGGRLLVIHDYGRDDVARLRGDRPEYGVWSRRDGPFLRAGFRIRVVHCFWTFASLDDVRDFLAEGFGEDGREIGAELTRPRISYNAAIYHRTAAAGAGRLPG